MKVHMKVQLPVEKANEMAVKGMLGRTIGSILEYLKPESAYFGEEDGLRTGYLIVNLEDAHKIPWASEPWFLAFNAKISITPLITIEDLKKAGPDIERAAKEFGNIHAFAQVS